MRISFDQLVDIVKQGRFFTTPLRLQMPWGEEINHGEDTFDGTPISAFMLLAQMAHTNNWPIEIVDTPTA